MNCKNVTSGRNETTASLIEAETETTEVAVQRLQTLVDAHGSIDKAAKALGISRDLFRQECRDAGVRVLRLHGTPTCIACLEEANTGVIVHGDVNLHVATLAVVGVPVHEAAATIHRFVDLSKPKAYCLCKRCAGPIGVTPLPLEGLMPLLTLDALRGSSTRPPSASEQTREGDR